VVRPHRFVLLLLVPTVLIAIGTVGYWWIEPEYTLFDALYMTVITLTTVGYEEVHRLSTRGRVFTIFLLTGGVFTLFFAATEMLRAVVSGEVGELLGRQRMEGRLAGLRGHVIVCGYGRMGKLVCRAFSQQKMPFVLVDRNAAALAGFDMPHGLPLVGEATSDEVLRHAGVERAQALVTLAPSDADNLYITLSARLLNDKLFIVSRAEGEPAENKLKRAGANRVVAPYAIGGARVAHAILRPNVVDFLDLATRPEFADLQIEEMEVRPGSRLAGKSLRESKLRHEFGIIIVAIKKPGGQMLFNPPGEARMEAGDTLIALGHREQIRQMEGEAAG
jgi:voltage-gated potassium channel